MRVLVAFGGRSGEHEVSVRSARSIVDALATLGHDAITVGISRSGRWTHAHPHDGDRVAEDGTPFVFPVDPHSPKDFDVVFPVFHGPFGEDGSLQGLFELADIAYVGAGVEGSAIGLNKWVHRRLFADAGIPVVNTLAFLRDAWDDDRPRWTAAVRDEIGFPCFVKPAHLGSSVGISRVTSEAELGGAMERAFQHDDLVLVEAFGGKREIEVGVIDGTPPNVSVVGEVMPAGDFYDYDSKYLTTDTDLQIPAPIPEEIRTSLVDLAIRAFGVARCEGFARIDFFYDDASGALRVNEINTIPGMTTSSMFPKVWEASGVPFSEVVQRLLDHAIERQERKAKLEAAREAAHDGEVGAS